MEGGHAAVAKRSNSEPSNRVERDRKERRQPTEPQELQEPSALLAFGLDQPLPVPLKKKAVLPLTSLGHRKRLRERLLRAPSGLLDYELLELLLCWAQPRGDVKPQAKALLHRYGNLATVFAADATQLTQIPGIGEAGVAALKVIPEVIARILREEMRTEPLLNTSEVVVDFCRATMAHAPVEQFRILFLDRKHYLIRDEVQTLGTLDRTSLYPREVVKKALALNAGGIIMVHNHPSGDPTPSTADVQATLHMKSALAQVDVHLLDHIVIARFGYVSLREKGLM